MIFDSINYLISEKVAWENIGTLATFEEGDKPVIDGATGKLTKERRIFFISFRRYYYGAFNEEAINQTFQKVISSKEDIEKLSLLNSALHGLKEIGKTYEKEGKREKCTKINKLATRLETILLEIRTVIELDASDEEESASYETITIEGDEMFEPMAKNRRESGKKALQRIANIFSCCLEGK